MAAPFNMSSWHGIALLSIAEEHGIWGVSPLRCTEYPQTYGCTLWAHTLFSWKTNRTVSCIYRRLSCCGSIKLFSCICSAISLITTLLTPAANIASVRFLTLHTGIHPDMFSAVVVSPKDSHWWFCLGCNERWSWKPADQRDTAERPLRLPWRLKGDFQPGSRTIMILLISTLPVEQIVNT